ncbi:hypothetical protein DEU56DRAFT_948630 [Suillus clintonianus]|uniref:uncharacterized protein n=1 Tax=Suillus clintonianus TaxID=1904413 RepID=UPI001B85B890|nr:uncharacterized protein DEU56DRAFT_948630 [Suillus clintonianus]KAG2135772.1 hypothetical protein DEU56DRAFT_948630 [Suillus clintonianus]
MDSTIQSLSEAQQNQGLNDEATNAQIDTLILDNRKKLNQIQSCTGGSRNIGYYSAVRLLALSVTVTFLLRSPRVFNQDNVIQNYIKPASSKAMLVDFLIFTVGGTPQFSLTKGFTFTPSNLVTQSLLNVLETLPSQQRDWGRRVFAS